MIEDSASLVTITPFISPCQNLMSTSESPRIRVLFVRPSLGQGGADKVTLTVLQKLNRNRIEPHLATLKGEGVWIKNLPEDVIQHQLEVPRVRGMLRPLTKLIRRLRPDVVFSTASGTNVMAVMASHLSGVRPRIVVSERNIVLNGGLRPMIVAQWAMKAVAYRFANTVTAVSGGVADDLSQKMRLPRKQIHVLFNPRIDQWLLDQSQLPLEHEWLGKGNSTLVAAGRLVPWKGHDVLLKAFQVVAAQKPEARLVLLGEGEELERLRAMARALGVADRVDFHGFSTNPYKFFSRAAVFVLSSYNEGLCNVLIEAMACGAPLVSTDCTHGKSEIIDPDIDGFLVPVGDHLQMADRVLRLLNDRVLAQQFSEAGKRSAWRFSVDNIMRRYESAILDHSA